MSTYEVITQHGVERAVRVTPFTSYEAAEAFAESFSPDTDGSLVPTLDDEVVAPYTNDERYERGFFWFGNRYAFLVVTS